MDTIANFPPSIHFQGTGNKRNNIAASLILVVALCLILPVIPAAAQSAGQGSLQGTVTDSSGAVIPNATVIATNVATSISTTRT
ncbi:MAG TPA: carboxypeptidase-like regulatory domain-containing protein, partial [Terracidiphilus sp.]|nr:carboxypeptidase-like regulatory domain-containing protein [Terracidiphilus sp.]